MLYLKRLCIDNKISYRDFCRQYNVSRTLYFSALNGVDISVLTLLRFKEYFVCNKILNEDFDIGLFLHFVD